MKDRPLIDEINPTFIALTAMVMHHYLLAWNAGEFSVLPEFAPGGSAQYKCDTSNIDHMVNPACTDGFGCLNTDFHSSSPEVQASKIDNIHRIICQRIDMNSPEPVTAELHNDRDSIHENSLDNVPGNMIELPDNSFSCLISFAAATETSVQFSDVLPMGASAIASSCQPVPSSDSKSSSDDITSVTNISSIENMGLVDGGTIVNGTLPLGG